MTTREATPFLSRSCDLEVERKFSDWAHLLAFGTIQWPWLLKSLYGGRKRDKSALLDRLGLPQATLPNLGSWKADVGFLNLIVDAIFQQKPGVVVELGAGASSLVVARALQLVGTGGRLVSYDQHADFCTEMRRWLKDYGLYAELRHAPLGAQSGRWSDLWYALEAIPETIDLLLIDGPPWALNPTGRGKAQCLFDRISFGGVVILDDAARPG